MPKLLLLSVGLFLLACSQPIDLPDFDEAAWKADLNGCNSTRAQMVPALLQNKSLLKGVAQRKIVQTLGNPDEHELSSRRQKFFTYYLQPGPKCAGVTPNQADSIPKAIIRFDALGDVNEVNIYN